MNIILIDFKSKQCRENQHTVCSNKWNGFGFEVVCNCSCHKKELMLDESCSLSNIRNSPLVRNAKDV